VGYHLQYIPLYACVISQFSQVQLKINTSLSRPWWTDPLVAPMVKILKLAIYLFLELGLQIWFQKYYIRPNGTQFLINKDKNRGHIFVYIPSNRSNEGVIPPHASVKGGDRMRYETIRGTSHYSHRSSRQGILTICLVESQSLAAQPSH
jgi:hypothetical protein